MRVIVFGGAGFLGSFVADALADAGHEVVIFDRSPSPYRRPEQREIVGDILDEAAVAHAVEGCDVVYNYAAIADIGDANESPLETIRVNVLGNTILLEASRCAGVKRFVFASTLYVYSRAGAFYRSGKQACELIIDDYHRAFGLPYTILRYGSLYGPRATRANGIHRILTQALAEGRIVREGDGEEMREYIHVWDAAQSSVDILASEFENANIIVTGQQPVRVKDLLTMVREILGGRIAVEYVTPGAEAAAPSLHYHMTPYSFQPTIARKLVRTSYLDLGQGLLGLIAGMYQSQHDLRDGNDVLLADGAHRGSART
ncbi:MAG: NAD-dependent epimerase/dehydratase family protein [Vicinamibacterales bacterium]